jgi:hypothetical protein
VRVAISPDIENGPFIGNGTQAAFAFTFTAITPAEVAVALDGVAQATGFSVSLNESGGSVTFATPPAAGAQIVLRSSPDYLQDSMFENEGAYNLTTVNTINRRQAVRALVTKKRLDATSVAAADASAGAAAASAAAAADAVSAAAGSASAASGAASAAATSAASAVGSAAAAASSVNGAALAAATAGAYPSSASANVPRGLTQASVGAITAGSSGTNGTFALAWSAGNFAVNPSGTFTVSGGALTAVTVTGPGLYIGASPSVPTPSFAASSGLSGAAVTLIVQFLVASGQGYWVQSADGSELDRYTNVGGVATAASGVGPVPLNGGAALAAATSIATGLGRQGLFRDPFFIETRIKTGMLSPNDDFSMDAGWVKQVAGANNPYKDSFELKKPAANGSLGLKFYLDTVGLKAGDTFAIGCIVETVSSSPTISLNYRKRDGTYIGSGITIGTGGTAPGTAGRTYISPDLTIPALTGVIEFVFACYGEDLKIRALWGHLGTASMLPTKPVDFRPVPRAIDRMEELEAGAPNNTNITLKAVSSTSRSIVVAGVATSVTTGARSGHGLVCLASAVLSPFNAVNLPNGLRWTAGASGPSRIYAIIRVAPTGESPSTAGHNIAEGWIGTDPYSGAISALDILLRDPLSGAVKTVDPSELGDKFLIAYYGVQLDGSPAATMGLSRGTTAAVDSATNGGGYLAVTGFGRIDSYGTSTGSDGSMAAQLVLLTNPVEVTTPSPTFSAAVGAQIDEAPDLFACPSKAWGIVGQETFLYFQPMMQRELSRTEMKTDNNGQRTEGVLIVPPSAGTMTVNISARRGDGPPSTKAVSVVSCSASAGAKTVYSLVLGDSLIEGGGFTSNLTAIATADAVTTVVNQGTKGTAGNKMEGYSGQAINAFLAATIVSGAGPIPNPFFNPGTSVFDFSYYVTNSLAGVAPSHVGLFAGFWNVRAGTDDASAAMGAAAWAAAAETIIASIHAYSATINVAVWTQPIQNDDFEVSDGQDGSNPVTYAASVRRMNRNLKIIGALAVSQFSGREASHIYCVPCGTCMDQRTAYSRSRYRPKNAAVAARVASTYSTYAALIADLAPTDEAVVYVADVDRYFVKEGPTGKGRWRGAERIDGFERSIIDGTHVSYGHRQLAQQYFAWMKNVA